MTATDAKRAAATEKRRTTLAAKKAADAELDRALARDAGFPQESPWLQGLAPKMLKSTPAFTSVRGVGVGWRVLAKAGPAVGDTIMVNLVPQHGLARPPKAQEVTVVSRLGARDGELWVLLGVDDPERLAAERAAGEKAAKAKVEAERVEALKQAEAAREEAVRKAEAAAREADFQARLETVRTDEARRVGALSVEAVRTEVVRYTEQVLRRLEVAPEALLGLGLRRDAAVNRLSEGQLRSVAAVVAVADALDVSVRPYELRDWLTVVDDTEEAIAQARAGRLSMFVRNRRGKQTPVNARFASLSTVDWCIVARLEAIHGEKVTVTRAGGECKSMLINSDVVHLGHFGGHDLVLIVDFEDAES